jgi:hypothetical protein
MNRSLKANAICRFFANRKDRAIDTKAKTNGHATLHARCVHAFYRLCISLRGLLYAATGRTAWQATESTQPECSWMSAMQPCRVAVRRVSPVVVVVA